MPDSGKSPSDEVLGLDDAYAVRTPEDNRRLYRAWAETYDDEFASARGYTYPTRVATAFAETFDLACDAAVLDVGCGTGLVAATLAGHGFTNVHGIDISPEMLAVAESKRLYASLIEADVTERLPWESGRWGAVISAGTFTHGHLGPEPIAELVRVATAGAPFALGINAEHHDGDGFGDFITGLEADGAITDRRQVEIPMYDNADDAHGDDKALVVMFRSG